MLPLLKVINRACDERPMKRFVPVAVMMAALMLTVTLFSAVSDDSDAAGITIEGRIVDDQSANVPGVKVTITSGTSVLSDTTDAAGEFSIAGVPSTTGLTIVINWSEGIVLSAPSYMSDNKNGSYSLNVSTAPSSGDVYTIGDITMIKATFTAYLMELDTSGNLPIADTTVTVSNSVIGSEASGTTDADGKFTVALSSIYNLSLSFDIEGYYPTTGLFFMKFTSTGTVDFSLSGGSNADLGIPSYSIPYEDSATHVRAYSLASSYPLVLSRSTGTVTSFVYNSDGVALQRAEISLTSLTNSSLTYSGVTDGNGKFTIENVVTGDYRMTVKVPGYKELKDSDVSIVKGTNALTNTVLTSQSEQTFFGMSPSHFMMLLGVTIGIILMLTSYLIYSGHLRPKLDDTE